MFNIKHILFQGKKNMNVAGGHMAARVTKQKRPSP